jgi:hypothetical protein
MKELRKVPGLHFLLIPLGIKRKTTKGPALDSDLTRANFFLCDKAPVVRLVLIRTFAGPPKETNQPEPTNICFYLFFL